MKPFSTKELLQMIILVILYILIGNARSIQLNPIVPGAVIAVNMIIPVIGGILFGWRVGALVGIFGTAINALTPAGSEFELAAIIPHGIMGFAAGYISEKFPIPLAAASIIIGHILNILSFLAFGLLTFEIINVFRFWYGLAFESLAGIITIVVSIAIYRLVIQTNLTHRNHDILHQ
jgi:uncharacterized membrane protein